MGPGDWRKNPGSGTCACRTLYSIRQDRQSTPRLPDRADLSPTSRFSEYCHLPGLQVLGHFFFMLLRLAMHGTAGRAVWYLLP